MAFEKIRSPDASQESKKQEWWFFRVFHNDKARAEKWELNHDKSEANELLKDIQGANKTENAREITEKWSKVDSKMLAQMLKNIPPERKKILDVALSYLWTNEKNNPEVIAQFQKTAWVRAGGIDTAWCMSFVQQVLKNLWKQPQKPTAWAQDGLKIGRPVNTPNPWDLVIVKRQKGGHIGFFVGLSDSGKPIIIWWNQWVGEVSVKEEIRPVLWYRSIV